MKTSICGLPTGWHRHHWALLSVLVCGALACFSAQGQPASTEWTENDHPDYITRLTHFGERPDWSHDGKRILFVGRTFGDVYEVEVATGIIRPVTHHYYHGGYTRALYLANGDILLSGPTQFDPGNWQDGRFRKCELWVLAKTLDRPPVRLGEYCWEGPCASRSKLTIAWAVHHGVYPNQRRLYQLWVADLAYTEGVPRLVNERMVLDNASGAVKDAVLETQNFRPPEERELIFQSSHDGTEVMGVNLDSGVVVNYSNAPESYDEPEGIFPDGGHTLVESNRHTDPATGGGSIDLYKLALDGSGAWERLTWFNEQGRYKATNPVVSDDGRYMALMVPRIGDVAGVGHGIYLYDFEQAAVAQSK